MKSHERVLLRLYACIVTDIARSSPRDAISLKRDLSRLQALVETRGSKVLTIDLVSAGKHFDRCLANETLTPFSIPGFRVRKGGPIPSLFSGMILRVFNDDGSLKSNVDIDAIRSLRQLFYAAKKIRMECDDRATRTVVREFFDIESSLRSPTLPWDTDALDLGTHFDRHLADQGRDQDLDQRSLPGLDYSESVRYPLIDSRLLDLIQRVADMVSVQIGTLPFYSLQPKHGPGAVSDPSDEGKYSFPHWPMKLELTFPSALYAFANEGLVGDATAPGLSPHEPPSKLIAVPKTQKAPRLIASEPTAHQWMQQAVARWLRKEFSRTSIGRVVSFRDQTRSQKFATAASLTGLGATIDLSSASDRLSLWCVERMFRSNHDLIYALHATRTRWVSNNIDKKLPRHLVLKKFAPMGSALTFPVQSIIYAIVAVATTLYNRLGPLEGAGFNELAPLCENVSQDIVVFGDDICCHRDDAPSVSKVLSYLGLKVNTEKSFWTGRFRESCGVDAYAGVDVTPTYFLGNAVESNPESIVSAVDGSNNFHKGGYWVTADWMASEVPEHLRKKISVVGPADSGEFGFFSFAPQDRPQFETWDNDLQRWRRTSLHIEVKVDRMKPDSIANLLQYFTEEPPLDQKWSAGEVKRTKITYKLRKTK